MTARCDVRGDERPELIAALLVAEARRGRDQERDGRHPLTVAPDLDQAVRRQRLERAACAVAAPEQRHRVRGRGTPHGCRRVAARELLDALLDLDEPALHGAQREQLDGVQLGCVLGLRDAADRERLGRRALGVVQAPVHHRAVGLVQRHLPEVQRVAQVVGQPRVDRELDVGADPVAELHQAHDPPDVAAQHELAIACVLAKRDDVGRDLQPLDGVLGPPEREEARAQRRGDRAAISEPARHRDRRLAELRALLRAVGVVQLGRHPPEHPRLQRPVVGAERLARVLQQAEERVVDEAELEAAHARAVAERRAREAARASSSRRARTAARRNVSRAPRVLPARLCAVASASSRSQRRGTSAWSCRPNACSARSKCSDASS